jgi:hypothetical protein
MLALESQILTLPELRRGMGMSAATEDIEHPTRTRQNQHRYMFTAKHHGGDRNAAMWLPEISHDVEFSIFDHADWRQIADSRGWLFGILLDGNGDLLNIGTWDEQVAEFQPGTAEGDPWHGYPQWALDETGPPNRRKQRCCPEREVFDQMVAAGLINKIQRKLFLIGRPA